MLISIDTMRADHLGCYGYDKPTSPTIDRLASEGVRFARARAQAPWTLISHMSMLTSRLPSSNGVESLNQVLSEKIPTLAEVLQRHGYQTSALVNNGQMRAHWGFARGFDHWQEFQVDQSEGSCESITAAALEHLKKATDKPQFLFLHYYDAHDPYDPPEDLREKFHATLVGDAARQVLWAHRFPDQRLHNPKILEQLKAAYDAEICRQDREIARLIEALPEDTLVVLLSDHGECFEEHGWTLHGATVYEEELRVPLVMWHPDRLPQGKIVESDVMLLDVVPTILQHCGIDAVPQHEGRDLSPLWKDDVPPPDRLVLAETKAVLESTALNTAVVGKWKLIYDQFAGPSQLFQLPDEQTNLIEKEEPAVELLAGAMRPWLRRDDYWMLHASGSGEFDAQVSVENGQFTVFVPQNCLTPPRGNEVFEVAPDGKSLHWRSFPRGATRSLYFQTAPRDAPVRFRLKINGEEHPDKVLLGEKLSPAEALPCTPDLSSDLSDPVITTPFQASQEGYTIRRHGVPGGSNVPSQAGQLDAETLRQLKTLGYTR